jgi:hypothetical protein
MDADSLLVTLVLAWTTLLEGVAIVVLILRPPHTVVHRPLLVPPEADTSEPPMAELADEPGDDAGEWDWLNDPDGWKGK